MTDAVTNDENSTGYTDEQIAAAFPGQDVAHARAMMDKAAGRPPKGDENADAGTGNEGKKADAPADTVEYPAYIPEKFRVGTVEQAHQKLAESYASLERSRGAADTGTADGDAGDGGADDGKGGADGANTDGDVPKLNLQDVESEWATGNGKLSQATYDAAAKVGMPPEVLDAYLAGQRALGEQVVSKVHGLVGGEKVYSEMLQWANKNWAAEDVAEFDRVMGTGNLHAITLAVKGLGADFKSANGSRPNLVNGQSDGDTVTQGFQSKAEMTAAMKDPRYRKDPAYRAEVARKIHTGKVWG